MKGQKMLVGHVAGAEVVKRTWILTITGEDIGASPLLIKKGIFDIAMDLAGKFPGARMVTVGTGHSSRVNRLQTGRKARPRRKNKTAEEKRQRKNELQRALRAKAKKEKPVTTENTGIRRKVEPERQVSADQAYEIYQHANGKLTQPHRLVISHLMGWGTKKMTKRAIGREFAIGGEQKVKEIAREGWTQLGLTRIKNSFEAIA